MSKTTRASLKLPKACEVIVGLELKIAKELTTLNATALEWQRITAIVNATLPNSPFKNRFNDMSAALNGAFAVVHSSLAKLLALDSAEAFLRDFPTIQKEYQQEFLTAASQPRRFAEATHEIYLELCQYKELKTGYPILKRTYTHLYEFMDKWVTNDAWLVMSCDVILKSSNRLLLEIAELFQQDSDEAWILYNAFFAGLKHYQEPLSCVLPSEAPVNSDREMAL